MGWKIRVRVSAKHLDSLTSSVELLSWFGSHLLPPSPSPSPHTHPPPPRPLPWLQVVISTPEDFTVGAGVGCGSLLRFPLTQRRLQGLVELEARGCIGCGVLTWSLLSEGRGTAWSLLLWAGFGVRVLRLAAEASLSTPAVGGDRSTAIVGPVFVCYQVV